MFGDLLTFLITCATLANGYQHLNCVESLPTSWTYEGTFRDQTEFNCYKKCASKKFGYFAVGGMTNQCYCGDRLPVTHTNTNTNIDNVNDDDEQYYGHEEEICGGPSSSYSLFTVVGSSDKVYPRDDQNTEDVKLQTSIVVSTAPTTQVVAPTNSANSGSALPSSTSGSPIAPTVVQTESGTGSGVTTAPTADSVFASTTTNADHGTSIVFHTSTRTQSGSMVVQTVTASSTPTPEPNQNKNDKSHHSHVNVGAIVGGVVGGIGGAAVLTVLLLLLIRHLNKRREQERMEQEYQEAIKPVDFSGFGHRGGSTGGGGGGVASTNNTSDKAPQGANTSIVSLTQGPSSSSFDDEWRDDVGTGQIANPFDDSRRISNDSFMRSGSPTNHKILTVVNPDEEDY